MFIRKATSLDFAAINLLWQEVFGDLSDYITLFISNFGIGNCYVCDINKSIVSMAFAIPTPCRTVNDYNSINLKYIYTCATHPDFQSQGMMKQLLENIYEDSCNENVAGLFLQAANHHLENYYRKLGFEDFFFRSETVYRHPSLPKSHLSLLNSHLITHTQYYQKRILKLSNRYFVNWDPAFFHFLKQTGTQFCELGDTIFSYKKEANRIIVDELLGETPQEHIAAMLFEEFSNIEEIHIRSIGNEFCCGQIKWCNSSIKKNS